MSKFKEKELLDYFDDMCLFLAIHHWTKRDERAVTIREMIKKKPGVTEEWIQKAIDYIAEYPSYKRLEKKLKEAGVEIVEK